MEDRTREIFRLAKNEERDEILKLYKMQLGRKFCPWDDHYPSEDTISFDLKRDALFLMEIDGKIVSVISIDQDPETDSLSCWNKDLIPAGEMARLAVHPDFQGRGIAKRMILNCMTELKKRGYKAAHYLVNKNNVLALNSYKSLEFKTVGECELFNQPFFCCEKEL